MPDITRVPLGLQKQLGLQTQGDNPSELVNAVAGGVNFDRYYDLQNQKWAITTKNVTGEDQLQIVVPQDEIWLLKQIGCANRPTGTTAGDNVSISAFAFNVQGSPTAATFHGLADFGTWTDTTNSQVYYNAVGQTLDDLPLFGGSYVRFAVNQVTITTGNWQVNGSLFYLRLKI